jgi:predicted component of type VI protein secretion system
MMKRKLFVFMLIAVMGLMFASCSEEESTENQNVNSDIPSDPQNVQVPAPTNNNVLPAATFEKTSGNENRIRVNLLGLFDPNTLQPLEIKANYSSGDQNFYLQEDGTLKGKGNQGKFR